ncbi:hypothetical protein ACIPZG_04135 [Pseudomonas sp. NPDC089395]|uniref:hypothetical protein n=1 Tax=Pseudomonas sp. NPDC089395 TaxID=3364460 RepID=UPI00382C6E38
MRRITQESAEQFQRELKELDEEIRKARTFSAWETLLPLGLGAGFALLVMVACTLILRMG